MNSDWGLSPETLNSCQNHRYFDPCDLDIWQKTQKKTAGHIFYIASSFVHYFVTICEFKLGLQFGNNQIEVKKWPLWLWPLNSSFCMDIIFVNCIDSWKLHDDKIKGTLWKNVWEKERQTDRIVLRAVGHSKKWPCFNEVRLQYFWTVHVE